MSAPATCRSDVFVEVTAELLRRGCTVRFRAGGRSMHPAIRDGESITVVPTELSEIKHGDIIAYRKRRSVLAHRVVRIKRSERGDGDVSALVMRGDTACSCDAPVAPGQVLGKVVAVERNGRRLSVSDWRAKVARAAHNLFTTKFTKITKRFRDLRT